MKILWIAEKPELGRLIAQVLGNGQTHDGYIVCGSHIVSWCIGHLVKLTPPGELNPDYIKWRRETLPMKLRPLQYSILPNTEQQFRVLTNLISGADEIIHAGDPDEEGQLLVEEILDYCGNKAPVKRVLINDLNPEAAHRAMRNLQDNQAFYGLYQRALARNAADYLYGLNMTRAYTIAAMEKGHTETISVGRVQTPVLGLVVRRFEENRDHKASFYWVVEGELSGEKGVCPVVLSVPDDAPVDEKKRIINEQYQRLPELEKYLDLADSSRKSRAFNDKKISAHTAIIPTPLPVNLDKMTTDEKKVYDVIVAQYLAQFMPEKTFESTVAEFDVDGLVFRQRAIHQLEPGWSALLSEREDGGSQDSQAVFNVISALCPGEQMVFNKVISRREATSPPSLYTEASLLEDLQRVAKYVDDPRIRQLLVDRDEGKEGEHGGIGTPATRSKILALLQQRGLMVLQNKKFVPTELGISFIHALPPVMTTPDMTALWHEQQRMIEAGELTVDEFLNELEQFISYQVEHVDVSGLKVTVYPCSCGGRYIRRQNDKGVFWGCNNYPDCRNAVPDKGGVPDFSVREFEAKVKCPMCGSKMKVSPKAYSCTNIPKCEFRLWGTQFNKELTMTQVVDLLTKWKTREIKGLKKKDGSKFDAVLTLNQDGSITPTFLKKKKRSAF
ncbi:topoisomerase C-terminal repeat-containing protein [Salmonella enterica subsp. enterica serovar Oranienburg]|nr:type IA DNA topoisomerase [Salmonella enterica subsp. enterica serovar Oranienburg]EHX6957588.1 topoisomerase C-terminal repeat-containing protein [Salmonella enterica subsp. enterica serovar Oranienburg]